VERLVVKGQSRAVLVDAEGINDLDSTAAEHLLELHGELTHRNIELGFARVRDPIREVMKASGVLDAIGLDHFHGSITQGIKAYKQADS